MKDDWRTRLVITRTEVASADAPTRTPAPPFVLHQPSPSPARKGNHRLILAFLAALMVVLVLAMTATIVLVRDTTDATTVALPPLRVVDDGEQTVVDQADFGLIAPSVLGRSKGLFPSTWGGTAIPWCLDRVGRLVLVTNRHVGAVEGTRAPPELEVEFAGGLRKRVVAIGIAADQNVDLAILVVESEDLIEGTHYRLMSPMEDAAWNQMAPGDPVAAIGSPHGYPQTRTFGRISALRDGLTQFDQYVRWIQIDCSVLPGNSGGPLVKADGDQWRWIGVVTASGDVGIGFAIFIGEIDEVEYQWIQGDALDFE